MDIQHAVDFEVERRVYTIVQRTRQHSSQSSRAVWTGACRGRKLLCPSCRADVQGPEYRNISLPQPPYSL